MPPIIVNSEPVLSEVESIMEKSEFERWSFDGFADQTIVERLRHVILLGFGMIDEL